MEVILIIVAIVCAVIAAGITDWRIFLSPETIARGHTEHCFRPKTASGPKNEGGPVTDPQSPISDI